MVSSGTRLYTPAKIEAVLRKCGVRKIEPVMEALEKTPRRHKAPPAPAGGICIRRAADKYNLQSATISRWVNKGFIPVIPSPAHDRNWKFINEAALVSFLDSRHNHNDI